MELLPEAVLLQEPRMASSWSLSTSLSSTSLGQVMRPSTRKLNSAEKEHQLCNCDFLPNVALEAKKQGSRILLQSGLGAIGSREELILARLCTRVAGSSGSKNKRAKIMAFLRKNPLPKMAIAIEGCWRKVDFDSHWKSLRY